MEQQGSGRGLPRWAVVAWTLLIAALIALMVYAGRYGDQKAAREARVVFATEVTGDPRAASQCLGDRLGARKLRPDGTEVTRLFNNARDLSIELRMEGARTTVKVSTPLGRRLRDDEAAALSECLSKS